MNKTCTKCGHLCHCIEADHEGCDCSSCACKEPEGVVVDDTNECEACQQKKNKRVLPLQTETAKTPAKNKTAPNS